MAQDWSADELTTLKTLWLKGVGSGVIAKELKRSRSSVMGKVNRLGLMKAVRGEKEREALNVIPVPTKPEKLTKPKAEPKVERAVEIIEPIKPTEKPPEPKTEEPRTIFTIRAFECRWPLGDPMDKAEFFCGCKTVSEKNPYCEQHSSKAFYTWNKPNLKLPRRV